MVFIFCNFYTNVPSEKDRVFIAGQNYGQKSQRGVCILARFLLSTYINYPKSQNNVEICQNTDSVLLSEGLC